jgi:hypothetical protein
VFQVGDPGGAVTRHNVILYVTFVPQSPDVMRPADRIQYITFHVMYPLVISCVPLPRTCHCKGTGDAKI